jgi:predicted short-subunit dehydrogenase-like oxidoreductase (DUF2520 family)
MKEKITYGIVGNGRMAKHMQHYFGLLNVPFVQWYRQSSVSLRDMAAQADVWLILVKDNAIEKVLVDNPAIQTKPCVHFSGSVTTAYAQSMHPLSNFPYKLHADEIYPTIPFVVEEGKHAFLDIFPMLRNPHYSIAPENRQLYHALCVLVGNVPTLIWQEASSELVKLNLPQDLFHVFLKNTITQYIEDPERALTGPFVRKDHKTIQKNESALQQTRLQKIYAAIREVFAPTHD